LCGEQGIGVGETATDWRLPDTQPFGNAIVQGMAAGRNENDQEILIAVDTGRRVSYTLDGETWSEPEILGEYDFEDISYFNRTFTILCSNGHVLRSAFSGGVPTWHEQASSPNVTERLNTIKGGNDIWIAAGNGGRIRLSTDATHFSAVSSPTTEDIFAGCFGQGKFVLGGANNTLLRGTSGDDFETITGPFAGNAAFTGLGFSKEDGLFIATNAMGEIATSSDLEKWSHHISPSVTGIRDFCAGNNRMVLGDDSGNVICSRVAVEIHLPGGGAGGDGNVRVGRLIETGENGRGTVRLIDRNGMTNGEIIRNIIMLRPGKTASAASAPQSVPHKTWDSLAADEILALSAKHNPMTEVDIA
ncbi:MAG TPA: hypothetical protein DEB39_06550, partial [Planctomycetaceae bacterium]|nr:hypothetical protein [Planctomycetaceae bacterium]